MSLSVIELAMSSEESAPEVEINCRVHGGLVVCLSVFLFFQPKVCLKVQEPLHHCVSINTRKVTDKIYLWYT